jgi:tetratricopeptide (TPR) repeat protein
LGTQLIKTRKELSKTTDDLLEQLTSLTPVDSFKSFKYFEVLARLCPIINSKADSIMVNSNFNINWNMLAANERADIFRTINTKTFNKAIATKDYSLAGNLIDSVENNGTVNAEEKDKPLLRKGMMANFYHLVKDTAAYIFSAIDYADNYLMKLNIDSINKAFKKSIEAVTKTGQPVITRPGGPAGMYVSQLNFHAWQFYKMTKDPNLLQKAVSWIKRAVDINATPEALGAYSLLLYDTGNRKEAIRQQKAMISSLKNPYRENELVKAERILARMKTGSEKVDE